MLAATPAQAGWFARFCERNLVMDAPLWAEDYLEDDVLDGLYLKEGARCLWAGERSHWLLQLGNEIRARGMTPRRTEMLDGYQQFEGAR